MRNLALALLMLASPALACDPEQPAPYSPSPVFEWTYPGLVEYGDIGGFALEAQWGGTAAWVELGTIDCRYRRQYDGTLIWWCPSALAVQRHLPVLPGQEYRLRLSAYISDYQTGGFVTGGASVTEWWCLPEWWTCDGYGCSEVRVSE